MRANVTNLYQIHPPNPGEGVEEIEVTLPGTCDTFQFDADVARVYLSVIREWKEREWLCCSGNFPPIARARIARPSGNTYCRSSDSGRCTDDGFGRLRVTFSMGGRNPDLILRDGGVGEIAARKLRQEGRSLW